MKITKYTNTKTKTGAVCTIDEAKKQVQVETSDTDDDAFLTALISVAAESVENDINSDILETTNVLVYTIGDEEGEQIQTGYRIYLAPLISISKIEKFNGSEWSEIAAEKFKVLSNFLWFNVDFLEPVTNAKKLRFTFKTGYTDATRPLVIKQAALLRIADLYTNERQGYNLNSVVENRAYSHLLAKHVRHYW